MAIDTQTRPAAARAFVRSLNILLKFARMYDFGHPRTAKQFDTAWVELRTALGSGSENEAGLLLGVSGDQLLLDGTPLESAAAEKSFARMLSVAGIASIHFSPKVTQPSLARFVRGFPTSTGSKPIQLAEQLKAALKDEPNIHVNEVCFVPADSAVARSTVAAQLAAHTLGLNSEKSDELFNDPERLLQLIVAAEGTKNPGGYPSDGPGGPGNGGGDGGRGTDSGGENTGYYAGDESEIVRGVPASDGESSGEGGRYVSGPVSAVRGSGGGVGNASGVGTWNIVGGEGGGTPLEPDAGGFWFNKDGAKQSSTDGQGTGARVDGGIPVHGLNFESRSSDFGTWNIVGGADQGTPLDPDAGGFWFDKDRAKGSGSKRHGSGGVNVTGTPVQTSGNSSELGTGGGAAGNIPAGRGDAAPARTSGKYLEGADRMAR
jgi:hypothetical protein